jgi:hypothetical protein
LSKPLVMSSIAASSCSLSMLQIHAARLCCLSILHVHAAYLCSVFMLHIHSACPWLHAACPCYKSRLDTVKMHRQMTTHRYIIQRQDMTCYYIIQLCNMTPRGDFKWKLWIWQEVVLNSSPVWLGAV